MKLNRSRQKVEFDENTTSGKDMPIEITITPATPISSKKMRNTSIFGKKASAEKSGAIKKNDRKIECEEISKEMCDPVEKKGTETQIAEEKGNQDQMIQSPTETEEFHSAINENVENNSPDKTIEAPNKDQDEICSNDVEKSDEKSVDAPNELKEEVKKSDQTSQLMDESVISVPESPSLTTSTAVIKDSTFSPEVDTSIKDARPHIDNILNLTPIIPRNITLRTSTPLSQRILMRDTPKLSAPVLSALKKVLSPKIGENSKLNEKSLNETFNGQIKMGNPLEKSILKSSRRKRSLSVTDGESFMQKKVAFMSPEIMHIDTIDEMMMKSFKEEKENSILKQVLVSGNGMRRKRSLSCSSGTPGTAKIKVPNFKAIHEQQFKKMESIVDHAQRKAERAKRLGTPSKMLSTLPEIKEKKSENGAASKIPTRKPLVKVPSLDNALQTVKSRPMKRSNSVETQPKTSVPSKITIPKENDKKVSSTKKLPRLLDVNKKAPALEIQKFVATNKKPTVASSTSFSKTGSSSQSMRAKVEERRERNMSLYKGNAVKAGLDHRKKNENVLKGVRLNRRFELQMQHRRMEESDDKA